MTHFAQFILIENLNFINFFTKKGPYQDFIALLIIYLEIIIY
jgi:hypothetical protein